MFLKHCNQMLILIFTAFWLAPFSVMASKCVTLSSKKNPNQRDITCKRVARNSNNGVGLWQCCPKEKRNE